MQITLKITKNLRISNEQTNESDHFQLNVQIKGFC